MASMGISWPTSAPLLDELDLNAAKYIHHNGFRMPRWTTRHCSASLVRRLTPALLVLAFLYYYTCVLLERVTTTTTRASLTPEQMLLDFNLPGANMSTRLPHIPPKIWQIYLAFPPPPSVIFRVSTWIIGSPSHSYTMLDAEGALMIVSKLASVPKYAHILPLFHAMSWWVLRADFLRYLLLAIEGGVYCDMDTQMVRPLYKWVPDEFKNQTKLIVGLEADGSPPVPETTYEVQFAQYAFASAPGHPALWAMVERILDKVKIKKELFENENPLNDMEYSREDVLEITGPAGWSEVVYAHLSKVTGTTMTWRNLTGMREPRLYGDTLVLPIDGFGTGLPHSNASKATTDYTMVKHLMDGAWKQEAGQHIHPTSGGRGAKIAEQGV